MDGFAWEWSLLHALQGWHTPLLNHFMVFISAITAGGIPWIILGFLLLIKRSTRIIGVSSLGALLVSYLVGIEGLKNAVARPRPVWLDPSVHMLVKIPKDFSFPSGHTIATFTAAGAVWYYKRYWGYLLMGIGGIVGLSRMYLYVHFPTDVLSGLILGLVFGVLVASIVHKKWPLQQKQKTVEEYEDRQTKTAEI